jgi:hypothetical protein
MSTQTYRLIVFVCAVSWFVSGLHMPPIVHEIAHHGTMPGIGLLIGTMIVALVGIATLLVLLLSPALRPTPPNSGV